MEVLNGKRYKAQYRGENLYIVVSEKDGSIYEIFADHATNTDFNLQYMMASIDALTRMVTLALKLTTLEKVIEQLERSSRQKNDLPGILTKALRGELVCE